MAKSVSQSAPVPRSRYSPSGAPVDPAPALPQGPATAAFVLGASALLFFPVFGPFSFLCGPPAWILGALDARRARAAHIPQSSSGNAGRQLGKWTTLACTGPIAALSLIAVMQGVL